MATNETLLTSLMRGPNDEAQSFLEGILNPIVHYEDIIDGIIGQLSNDDTNAMRCASRKMDNGLMALRGDGILRHRQKTLRDKCDETDLYRLQQLCPNGSNSSALLRRCSRGRYERGFDLPKSYCHNGIDGFLVCTTCDHQIRRRIEYLEMARFFNRAQRPVCAACAEKKERQYPLGGQLCQCLANFRRRVLCHRCVESNVRYLCSKGHIDSKAAIRIRRGPNHQISPCVRRQSYVRAPVPRTAQQAKAERAAERAKAVCAGCRVGFARWKEYSSGKMEITLICTICNKYTIAPTSHPVAPAFNPHRPTASIRKTRPSKT